MTARHTTSVASYMAPAPVVAASPAMPSARTLAAAPNQPIDTTTWVMSSSFRSGLHYWSCTPPAAPREAAAAASLGDLLQECGAQAVVASVGQAEEARTGVR
jgi:hypothetical protein